MYGRFGLRVSSGLSPEPQNPKPHETMDYLRCHISTQSSKLCHDADPFCWIELSGTFVDLIARPHGNMFQLEHAALVDLHTRRRRLRDGWHGLTLKVVKPDMGRVASHAELLITLLAEKCEQINKGHARTQNAAGSSRRLKSWHKAVRERMFHAGT